MAFESAIAFSRQPVNMGEPPKRKRGRPPMSSGNRARTRVKGLHLSGDCCEMLEQLSIVIHDNESKHAELAIRDYFIRLQVQYRQSFGDDYWDNCLRSNGHVNRLKVRRIVTKVSNSE